MTLLFAWRYFKSKKTTNAVNLIAWISILAIAVGAAALILVLSVFNGFEDLVKTLYADFYTDIRIAPADSKFLTLNTVQLQQIRGIAGVKQISANVEEKAVLVNGDFQSIVFLKGVDSAYPQVSGLANHVYRGKFNTGTADNPFLFMGAGIENAVAVQSDLNITPLTVYLPNIKSANLSGLDALNSYNANVSGSFVLQQEFDNKYVITNIDFLKYMLDLKTDQYTAVEIAVADNKVADKVQDQLKKMLGKRYKVETRFQQNQGLYSIMQVEKWVIYGILSLILIVAAFNMIGALTMLVLEKYKDIAVLKAIGASDSYIKSIFLKEGLLLAAIGGGGGMFFSTIVCLLQIKFKFVKLSGGSFIIDYYPVKMLPFDYLLVIITITLIAVFAAWLPSNKAAKEHFSLKS